MKHQIFKLDGFDFSFETHTLTCRYSYGDTNFEELVKFDASDLVDEVDETSVLRAAKMYFFLAGTSYYKAFFAPEFELGEGLELNQDEADFYNQVYLHGLGEFIYLNKLKPEDIAKFSVTTEDAQPAKELNLDGRIVSIGGGKDSLVTVELLKERKGEFTALRVNSGGWLDKQLELIGAPTLKLERKISQNIIGLEGALNGHVPVTGILSAAFVLQAILSGKRDVILSNEASANLPNTNYCGMNINHQYSKSLSFENDFVQFVNSNVVQNLRYFSLLRPLSELKIAQLFNDYAFRKYSGWWSSANENFKQGNMPEKPSWDVNYSEKILSVYGMLAAFIPRAELDQEFNNQNLFKTGSKKYWDRLLGNEGIKPFECVADTEEMKAALLLARETGDWPELEDFEIDEPEHDWEVCFEHAMPKDYEWVLDYCGPK